MSIKNILIVLALVAGFSTTVFAFEVPRLDSPVIDEVGMLSESTRRQIENSLFELKKNSQIQLQVYIAKSLQGEEIESAAIKIFDQWKIGDEKTDKGLLFLIAPNEKRMRIEVGQGLEGEIPDVIAKRIISDVVRPYFQRGEYAMGVAQGVSTLQNYLTGSDREVVSAQDGARATGKSAKKGGGWIILFIIGIWILIFIFNPALAIHILFAAMSSGGGGGRGRDSWSGGGGRSSGGGASGGW